MMHRPSFYTYTLLLLMVVTLGSCFMQPRPRRAQRQYQKENYAKSEQLLQKTLEKDSLQPAAFWLLSQLYLDTAYQQNIDTAHFFIMKALQQAPLEETKDRKRWPKLGLDSTALALQHMRVDSAAFARASTAHTVAAYQYFLDNYALAEQVAEAIELRNALAFAAAEDTATWQGYQTFFQTYPEARQVEEARERYEELLFNERTRTGTLQAYKRFLAEFPQTPYRDRLLRNIYRLSTADHLPTSYYQYIQEYPESPYSQQALKQLYYLQPQPAKLWQDYPELPRPDSLSLLAELSDKQVLAVLQSGKWGFMAEDGATVLPAIFDDVHPDYVCESLLQDVAEVFANGQPQLVSWSGQVLVKDDYEAIEQLSPSLLRVQVDSRQGLLFKSGRWLLPPNYSGIRMLGNNLLLVHQEQQMGLLAPNGQWLLPPQPDSLARLQDFILRYRGSRIALHSRQNLMAAARENKRLLPDFSYQSIKLLADTLMLAVRPDSSWQILKPDLSPLLSGQDNTPVAMPGALVLQQADGYQLLDPQGREALPGRFEQVAPRMDRLLLKQNGRWSLWQLPDLQPLAAGFDSLQLIHSQLLRFTNSGQDSLLFLETNQRIAIQPKEQVRILRPYYLPDTLTGQRNQFDKVVVMAGKSLRLYNMQGKQLLQGRYADVQTPDPALLILKTERGRTTLADTSGQQLLKAAYDGIGNYNNGYVALLKGNRFGTFSPYTKVSLNPQFDAAPRPYSNGLIMASKAKKWGLVDTTGNSVLPYRYRSIQYWSDSIALVQEEQDWQLLNISQSQPLLGEILEVRWLRQASHPSGGIAVIETLAGYGIASTRKGILAAPHYDHIENLGTLDAPLFYLERETEEEEPRWEVSYMNKNGKLLLQNTYNRAEWEMLLCD